jgi:Tol biopolymer transport system component
MCKRFGVLLVSAALSARADAQIVQLADDVPAPMDSTASIDAAGSVAYTVSTVDPFGTNPGHSRQIFRWNPATGAGTQVTSYEEGVETVSVSGDGTWLAFVSCADLLGTNHDESPELYVMHSDGTGLAQLTSFNLLPRPFPRGVVSAVISGSANRIVFTGAIDPFGTNPTLSKAVFVVDRDGSNLKQLAIDLGDVTFVPDTNWVISEVIDISDDGSRVIFEKANQLYGINADGTGLHTFPSSIPLSDASISGNGLKVVWDAGILRATTFVQPGTVSSLGAGDSPSITDDGTVVSFYRAAAPMGGIYRVDSTGGTATLVSSASLRSVRASGDGARLVARDFNAGSYALDNLGGSVQQLTQAPITYTVERVSALSPGGNRAWYLAGVTPGSYSMGLFVYDFDAGTRTQLTDPSTLFIEDSHFRASDAGDVVFVSDDNPTGQNPGGGDHLFKLSAQGTITQLTFSSGPVVLAALPAIRGDGQQIVFQGATLTGEVPLYRMNGDGTGMAPIHPAIDSSSFMHPAISEGTPHAWVAYTFGPDQILYRVKTDGSGLQRITLTSDACYDPSISGDGNRIAFASAGDFAGQNADHSYEAFLWDATTQLITQLTHDQGENIEPRITRNGQWVFTGELRIAAGTGVAEPAIGFLHTTSFGRSVAPNATGTAWAFGAKGVIDRSPSGFSLYRATTTVAPKIEVGKASPTLVTWDPSPGVFRYDVIRGSVGNLALLASTVDLGTVVCLEDDSPDNHVRGFEDASNPAPGQAFFFLYRGSVGLGAATGSYGQGTGGKERVAGSGGCNP